MDHLSQPHLELLYLFRLQFILYSVRWSRGVDDDRYLKRRQKGKSILEVSLIPRTNI